MLNQMPTRKRERSEEDELTVSCAD